MMKSALVLLLISSTATALTLADYPSMFFTPEFNATIIIPDSKDPSTLAAANYLVSRLPDYTIRNGKNKTSTTKNAIKAAIKNSSEDLSLPAIILGTPCNNQHIFFALPHLPCTTALLPNTARIILREGPTLTITAEKSSSIPIAIRYLHENAVQHHGQEIHLTLDQTNIHATVYKDVNTPAYSIQNKNGSSRNNHIVRRRQYGTTIKS